MTDRFPKVAGNCPMGCGETPFLGAGGHVTCSLLGCPCPVAVDELLADRETEHIVAFGERGFTIQHPLRERIDGSLFVCSCHEDLRGLAGPPGAPGRYRARRHQPDAYSESYRGGAIGWDFELIEASNAS